MLVAKYGEMLLQRIPKYLELIHLKLQKKSIYKGTQIGTLTSEDGRVKLHMTYFLCGPQAIME